MKLFLAPTGAQGVTIFVLLSIRLIQVCVENLRSLYGLLAYFAGQSEHEILHLLCIRFFLFPSLVLWNKKYGITVKNVETSHRSILHLKLFVDVWMIKLKCCQRTNTISTWIEMVTKIGAVHTVRQNTFDIKWRRLPVALELLFLVDSLDIYLTFIQPDTSNTSIRPHHFVFCATIKCAIFC